jgi:hypothetical protein
VVRKDPPLSYDLVPALGSQVRGLFCYDVSASVTVAVFSAPLRLKVN